MSEVTAEMIENGRARDPVSATRRRKVTLEMRDARERLTTSPRSGGANLFAADLMRLFAQSHRSAMPVMCLLVISIGVSALMWVPPVMVMSWTAIVCMALALVYGFSVAFLDRHPDEADSPPGAAGSSSPRRSTASPGRSSSSSCCRRRIPMRAASCSWCCCWSRR